MLPPPVVERVGRFWVVRDDLLPGGSKVRALAPFMAASPASEFVYAGPGQGYAQVALAVCARALGKRATVFTAARRELHPLTAQSQALGAQVHQVPFGRLSVVRARAAAYALAEGAELLPFGLDQQVFIQALAVCASQIPAPSEVWSVAGSGVLTRALQMAWPGAQAHAVVVGARSCDTGRATRWEYPHAFTAPAAVVAPFPSAQTYDAKGWELMQQRAREGALFWNVAG